MTSFINKLKNNQQVIVAEVSGNHAGDINVAKKIIKMCADKGVDAVKLQTYTPETLTLNVKNPNFKVDKNHDIWGNRYLFDLYQEGQTPWEWHEELFRYAKENNIFIFSSPFDISAVEFLKSLGLNVFKIASLENCDYELISSVSDPGNTVIISTGATTLGELEETVEFISQFKDVQFILLLCTSLYPTLLKDVNLNRIDFLIKRFGFKVGFSDHTLGIEVSKIALTRGICLLEKHVKLNNKIESIDSFFSIGPDEIKELVDFKNNLKIINGFESWSEIYLESASRKYKRSLYICKDVKSGEEVTKLNVRSIRPSGGLEPKYLNEILGKKFKKDYQIGTPLEINYIE